MIMDNKGRLFGKISIIDILIIVIIVGGLAGLAYKMSKSNTGTLFTKTENVQMVFYTDATYEFAAKAIKVGDVVRDKVANTVIGKVTDVAIADSVVYGFDSAGRSVASPKKGWVSINVTVVGQGVLSDSGVTLGTNDYFINKTFETRFGVSDFVAYISDIKKLKE